MRHLIALSLIAGFSVAACELPADLDAPSPRFAHLSNSHADLTGPGGITGKSVVNFTKNTSNGPAWRSNVSLKGDLAAGTYEFYLLLVDPDTGARSGETLMCTFDVEGNGSRQGCSSDANVGGFNTAEVRDGSGGIVASGSFDRRGGQRTQP